MIGLYLIKVIVISSSGALSPGPLTVATMVVGTKHGWKGGLKTAFGHLVVELPLVLLIAFIILLFGTTELLKREDILRSISIVGGLFLIFFSYMIIRDVMSIKDMRSSEIKASPLLVGITLSALNPFFIIWWIGVGSPLIAEALIYWSYSGIILFYAAHVWLDFVWLTFLAHITSLSGMSFRIYRSLLFLLGILILVFGLDFIGYGMLGKHIITF